MSEEKKPAKQGAPTKYYPEMADISLSLMREGASKHEVARYLEISYQSLLNYERTYPEFFEAIKKGESWARGWFERDGRVNLDNPKYQFIGWSMQMRNRFRYAEDSTVILPEFENAQTYNEKCQAIFNGIAREDITPKQASALMDIVVKAARVEETTELRDRLDLLEEKLESKP